MGVSMVRETDIRRYARNLEELCFRIVEHFFKNVSRRYMVLVPVHTGTCKLI